MDSIPKEKELLRKQLEEDMKNYKGVITQVPSFIGKGDYTKEDEDEDINFIKSISEQVNKDYED